MVMMKYISFKWIALFVILISLISSVHASNRLTGQDLKDIIKERAERSGINVEAIIAAEKVFYPCEDDLQIAPKMKDSWKTVEVICRLPYAWKLNIRTKLTSTEPQYARLKKRTQPKILSKTKPTPKLEVVKKSPPEKEERALFRYVVLAEPVSKGTVLNEDIAFDFKDYRYEVRGGFTGVNKIIGRKLKHSVPQGAPVLARHLMENYAVEKNTILDITVVRSGVEISGKGVALSNGQLGEVIIVSNISSGVKLKARIKNVHEAEIIAKHSR